MTAERLCKNCEWWDDSNWVKSHLGDCRRHAPRSFLSGHEAMLISAMRGLGKSMEGDEENLEATKARWPVTSQYDFCGEFSPNETCAKPKDGENPA